MQEEIMFGPTPSDEKCAQIGDHNYRRNALLECHTLIRQIRRQFGQEPEGCELHIASCLHDFGTYFEVAITFDTTKKPSVKYAFDLDRELPKKWDEESRKFLINHNYTVQVH